MIMTETELERAVAVLNEARWRGLTWNIRGRKQQEAYGRDLGDTIRRVYYADDAIAIARSIELERELAAARERIGELERGLEHHQAALLKVRVALGLDLNSHDSLVEVAEQLRAERDAANSTIVDLGRTNYELGGQIYDHKTYINKLEAQLATLREAIREIVANAYHWSEGSLQDHLIYDDDALIDLADLAAAGKENAALAGKGEVGE